MFLLLTIQTCSESQGQTLAHGDNRATNGRFSSGAVVEHQHHAVETEVADTAVAEQFPVAAQSTDQVERVTLVRASFRPTIGLGALLAAQG